MSNRARNIWTQAEAKYFQQLQATLKAQGFLRPSLVIDLDRLDHNIQEVMSSVQRAGKQLRVVEKSLPCPGLLGYIANKTAARRLMSFHQPFLNQDAGLWPDADILLGKPMPVAMAERFYQKHRGAFDPRRQLQWLIDTPERLQQYLALARKLGTRLNINLELDVGLCRGGIAEGRAGTEALRHILSTIEQQPEHFAFTGFMGYDPHVVMLPRLLGTPAKLLAHAMAVYRERVDQVQQDFPALWAQATEIKDQPGLTLNTAGSPTYRLHETETVSNEISVGSGLLKPADFDLPSLSGHQPAVFIATPVLKNTGPLRLPGLGDPARLLPGLGRGRRDTIFIYGGNWLADYVWPPGLKPNRLYGRSSNQEIATVSASVGLKADDLVFLRPRQSEAVLLQFGDLVIVRSGEAVDTWPVFDQ
ncbi:alanine racemase [Hydrocarboniclastica marina]|uniref:DSD1 family PLP-dependent enzyme n=1 Tax=Hydrocarboniclastica marina TaxID=2259620 RepID=A0A4P7XK74_9ALTE|nr:alanine racemase [Hydrocarboniclastica marina]QCF27193.1 DSD1 family PLP-dependent enzyme [Hydrocarboniclastica marina]